MSEVINTQYIDITAQEFINAWSSGYKGVKKEEGKGYWEDDWGNVVFENILLNEDIHIRNMKDLPFISLKNALTKSFSFDNSEVGGFDIRNSTLWNLKFESTKIKSTIRLCDEVSIQDLHIYKLSTVGGELLIESVKTINKITLEAKELRKVTIIWAKCRDFIFSQDSFCNLSISRCEIGGIQFFGSIIPKDSVFQISDSSIGSFTFNQFVNLGLLQLVNIEILERAGSFCLIDSDLGKTNLINCDLDGYGGFLFYNTKMLEVFVAGTELPKKAKHFGLPINRKNEEKPTQQRLAYSQFKKISENRGDYVQATECLALEMDVYAKQIFFNLLKKPLKFGELINIGLNKISSNHGNNWFQAVIVTLIVNSLCFWWYCHSLGYTCGNDYDFFWELASFSLEFLNPLRKADFLPIELLPTKVTPLARVADYASRIIVAYFTYQTIQAFRRFGKR